MNPLLRLGIAATAVYLVFGKKGDVSTSSVISSGKEFFPLAQGDARWGTLLVGDSSRSMADIGCMFTSLLSARNALVGGSMLPPEAMAIVKRAQGFQGALLVLPTAASALGVSAPEKERIRAGAGSIEQLKAKADDILARNGFVLFNVGYNNRTPQHFVICKGKSAAGYECMDVAGPSSKQMILDHNLEGQRTATKRYVGVGVAGIFRS